jgi:hypothetical protein
MDASDKQSTQLFVPGVTTYGDLTKMIDEVGAASKTLGDANISDAGLKSLRDKRKKTLDDFLTAARAEKGAADATIPKDEADKLDKMTDAINLGGIDAVADWGRICIMGAP